MTSGIRGQMAALLCMAVISASAVGQTDARNASLGVHLGGNVTEFGVDKTDTVRVGVQAVYPISGFVSLYPMAALHLDRAKWQVSLLGRGDLTTGVYAGAGLTHLKWDFASTETFDVLLFGLEAAVGSFQPFVEFEVYDGLSKLFLDGANPGAMLYVGVNGLFRWVL